MENGGEMAEIHQILMIFTKLAISQSVLHQKRYSWTCFVGGGYVNLYPYPNPLVPIPAARMGMPYPCICLLVKKNVTQIFFAQCKLVFGSVHWYLWCVMNYKLVQFTTPCDVWCELVKCQLWPQAKSQAKPSQASSSGLDGFWPGLWFYKAQAVGLGALELNFKLLVLYSWKKKIRFAIVAQPRGWQNVEKRPTLAFLFSEPCLTPSL